MHTLSTILAILPCILAIPTSEFLQPGIEPRGTPSEDACQGKMGHLVCLSTTEYTICNPDWPSVMSTQPGVICKDGNFINLLGDGPAWSIEKPAYESLLEARPTWTVEKPAYESLLDAKPTWKVEESPNYKSLLDARPTWTVQDVPPQPS